MRAAIDRARVKRHALLALLGVVSALTITTANAPDARAARYRIKVVKLTKGLTFTRVVDRRGPNRIRVLDLDLASGLTPDVALARNKLPGFARTSSMTRRKGAIAGINGAVGLPWGRPTGIFMEDGELETTPIMPGRGFAVAQDKQTVYIQKPATEIRLRDQNGHELVIKNVNEVDAPPNQLSAYTPAGKSAIPPPYDACSARLQPVSDLRWGAEQTGTVRDYFVEAVYCGPDRLGKSGGIVVSTHLSSRWAPSISALLGSTVSLSWSVGWMGVVDAMAGNPILMKDGVIRSDLECGTAYCRRHPRTGVGVTAEGHVLLITVDGRQPGYSVGVTLKRFAKIFAMFDAVSAVNLDGGGSTTMVVDGKVRNRPSDSTGERLVPSAFVVLPGPDFEEPTPGDYVEPSPAPTETASPTPEPTETASSTAEPTPSTFVASLHDGLSSFGASTRRQRRRAGRRAALDPASTGGYLHALATGAFGYDFELSPELLGIVRLFTEARTASE